LQAHDRRKRSSDLQHRLAQAGGTDRRVEQCRGVDVVGRFFDQLPAWAWLAGHEPLLALALLSLTAVLVGLGVPGVLLPISFSSGALLGGWMGMLVVIAGAVLGSQALFAVTRSWLADRARRRWGARLSRLDRNVTTRGFYYLLALRLVGAPHMLVTTTCALSAIRARSFVLATLLGLMPAVTAAAMAGSAV
jgi:uncharacterized membrane protein YdjX (TVP38/TMEM64 family)